MITTVVGLAVIGVTTSLWVFQFSRAADRRRIEAEFGAMAAAHFALTQQIVAFYQYGLYALKSLFEGSDRVSPGEFREIATDLLTRHPGVAALEWVPVVPADQRTELEALLSREFNQPFRIMELGADGTLVPAGIRPEYVPIAYIEPMAKNDRAWGLDVQTAPTSLHLSRARRTRQFTVTAKFELVQGGSGIVMAWPVFQRAPGETPELICRGFVQGVFRVGEMLNQTSLRFPERGFDELYLDESAAVSGERVLHARSGDPFSIPDSTLSESDFHQGIHREYQIDVGGRRWTVLYRPTAAWVAEQQSLHPHIWLSVGLVFTGLLAALVTSMARRTSAIQRQVNARTIELTESRRQLSNLLHALPGMAFRFSFDEWWSARFVSEGAFPLTGYGVDEFLERDVGFRALIHADDQPRADAAIGDALKRRGEVEIECRIRPRSGTERWVLLCARCVVSEDGQPEFLEGLALDITARKQAETDKRAIERKLLETQKLESLGLLAGGIAHDFNNILTAIMGHASLARATHGESETGPHLAQIEASVSRASELCQQMLAFSGRGHFVIEPVDLNRIVRETLPLLQGSQPTRARIDLALSPQRIDVMGDPSQLRQITMNLILNAAEALPPTGGEVTVVTGVRHFGPEFFSAARVGEQLPPGDYVFLEVHDTGCGMDSRTLAKIFDPFFTTKFTGRGLGLAAVLGIVRGHAGALRVQSQRGLGTTFILVLPPAGRAEARDSDSKPAIPWRRSGRVLVIDDEAPVREIAAQLLRSFGLTAATAEDGARGLAMFRRDATAFDLVFLDLTMPGLDGVETLAGLRAANPAIRVLLASGFNENDRVAQLAASGPVVFLQKPFSREQLEQKLREIFDGDVPRGTGFLPVSNAPRRTPG